MSGLDPCGSHCLTFGHKARVTLRCSPQSPASPWRTHLALWNVEGPGFFALHTAFQTQYEELFTAIDEIAERLRAMGAYAIGGLATHAAAAQIKEFAAPMKQEDYVRALLSANEKLVKDAIRARDLAGEVNDPETQDLMTERITLHQKTLWMLGSFLKA